MKRLFGARVIALCLLATVSAAVVMAQTPLEKLRVAYTVIAPTQATIWTAQELGFYAKHGLDVDLVLLVGAPLAVAALVGGETPIAHAGASAVITSNLSRFRGRPRCRWGQSFSLRSVCDRSNQENRGLER